jgi:hypothetical protein
MSGRTSGLARRTLPAVAALLGVALVVVGCSSGDTTRTTDGTSRLTTGVPAADPSSDEPQPAQSEGPLGAEGPEASDSPDPALSGQTLPTVPPGDPGDDTSAPVASETEKPGPRTVPANALLDAPTVGAVAGGTWTASAAPPGWCATPRTPGSAASRAQLLTAAEGRLVQSVSAYADSEVAVRAVATATDRLVGCGFTRDRDPRLGQASELLTGTGADGAEQTVVVLASEGVGVVLVATGSAAATGSWDALADLALGSSCAAAEHGCH